MKKSGQQCGEQSCNKFEAGKRNKLFAASNAINCAADYSKNLAEMRLKQLQKNRQQDVVINR